MKVNIAVCGKFHYANYVKYLDDYGVINKLFYSHKISTNQEVISVSQNKLSNVWIKEYLVFLHQRLFNKKLSEQLFPIYHDIWENIVMLGWEKCDIFHIMINGNARKVIRKAKEEGSLVLGDAVSSHPEFQLEILQKENEKLGIRNIPKLSKQRQRLIEEINNIDYLLTPSSIVRNSYIQKGFNKEKIFLIPFGVSLNNFYKSSNSLVNQKNDSIFRVICVAQITPRKGHIYLLEAWKKLNLPNSELLLIGNIDNDLIPVISKYEGLFKHIQRVPHRKLFEYYNQSSVFVLPSLEDGFAYVCLEAMACGLPVITTTNTGASDIIENNKQGFIIPTHSSEAISSCLEKLYLNHELRAEMSQSAIIKSQTDLSWRRYGKEIFELYQHLQLNR